MGTMSTPEQVGLLQDQHGEQDIEVVYFVQPRNQIELVAFIWPCGEEFSFNLEALIEFNAGARKAGVVTGQEALLNMADLGMEFYYLAVNPSDDILRVYTDMEEQVAFEFLEVEHLLFKCRKGFAAAKEAKA